MKIKQRRVRSRLVVGLFTLFACSALIAPSLASARTGEYVSLGDSFTAGSGVLPTITDSVPLLCAQSGFNYPHRVQARIHYSSFRDVSCGGATTDNLTGSQSLSVGSNPPQYDALKSTTTVVTMGMGGNDIGFGSIATSCIAALPLGHPCRDKYIISGVDTLADKINAAETKIASAIQGIHDRSPLARVVVAGYPAIMPSSGPGCWPVIPVAPEDVSYLDGVERTLNAMIKRAAANNNATYVDVYTPSLGHDACKPWWTRWVEPLVPLGSYVPLHPNARGETGMSLQFIKALY
ncbi:MAG: SGNH/GDSL hydrolase family protein [Thermoleophilaceae bacterium]|nr:SGNH/GDSL hydrolase family protein [Thermoleophilaceae bacterium]